MIRRVRREDYSSEEEYLKAYEEMSKAIKQHNEMHSPKAEYNPDYKREFLDSLKK